MNGSEITKIVRCDSVARKRFGGVLAADELPSVIGYRPRHYVVNTDVRGQPGTHWVAFFFPKTGPAEFFDSLGRAPEHYNRRFKNVLIYNGPSYAYNNVPVQPDGTNTCGQYCLHYLTRRCRGRSMKKIVRDLQKIRKRTLLS